MRGSAGSGSNKSAPPRQIGRLEELAESEVAVSNDERLKKLNQALALSAEVLADLPPEKFRGTDQLRAAVMDAQDALEAAIMDLQTQPDEGQKPLF